MLFSILSGGDVREMIISLLLTIPVILISLSVHEAAHGYIAMKMGDRTAYNLGRVTINPAKHLDPIGSLCMLVFGYGWAKPVPINARNFKNPKRGMAFTAIAGPISNIIVGAIGAVLFSLAWVLNLRFAFFGGYPNEFVANVMLVICNFFYYLGIMNFMLAAFNMIPIPPFDGSRFFSLFLPQKTYFAIMKYERQIMLVLLVGLFACSRMFNFSPFSWVAEKLFYLIATPLSNLFMQISF